MEKNKELIQIEQLTKIHRHTGESIECQSDHRTISLIFYTLKFYTRVDIDETQFRFWNCMGVALLAFDVLVQQCLDINQNLFV